MNERSEKPRACQFLKVRAWLRKSSPNALDASYPEVMADKGIQRDPPRDDVPSRLLPRKVDRVEDFCFNKRQLVAAPVRKCRSVPDLQPSVGGHTGVGLGWKPRAAEL